MRDIIFFGYIAFISTIGTVLCIYDKIAAKSRGSQRVRESTLCALGVLGGALCMLLTMLCIRHKTQHTAIIVLMSAATVVWSIAYAILFGLFIV